MNLINFHDAIFNRIRENVDPQIKIFDYLPPKENPPFVVIGKTTYDPTEDLETKDMEGYVINQRITIVTEARERHKAVGALKQIRNSLKEDLSIEGSFLLRQKLRGGEVEETEDAFYIASVNADFWLLDEEEL